MIGYYPRIILELNDISSKFLRIERSGNSGMFRNKMEIDEISVALALLVDKLRPYHKNLPEIVLISKEGGRKNVYQT